VKHPAQTALHKNTIKKAASKSGFLFMVSY
jgi:hypothetical protein